MRRITDPPTIGRFLEPAGVALLGPAKGKDLHAHA
jgi:hypothetical protein